MKSAQEKSPVAGRLIRPLVRRLRPYEPGEQPKEPGLIKLNTNENPYPPSPKVLQAIRNAADRRLRLYPPPTADPLRQALASFHGCRIENIIVGNGSDELLAMAVRAFVEPLPGPGLSLASSKDRLIARRSKTPKADAFPASSSTVQSLAPSYSLYPVLAAAHGALFNSVPLETDYSLPPNDKRQRRGRWDFHAALTCLTTPNAPSGRGYAAEAIEDLCRAQRGVVVLDEAYADFADQNAMRLALDLPNVIVSRTFSKAYSLCFLRVGYFIGPPDLIGALHKIRDSYNVNGLAQIAALTTLRDLPYYQRRFRQIQSVRRRLSEDLAALGFHVVPSETNFVWARPGRGTAAEWMERLRHRKILVRWFSAPKVKDYLRITVGTEEEIKTLLNAVRSILKNQLKNPRPLDV